MIGWKNIMLPKEKPSKKTEQITVPEKPKAKEREDISEVRKRLSPVAREEFERRKDAERLVADAAALDERFRALPMGISPERKRTIDVMETLAGGQEDQKKRKAVSGKGVNGITIREYAGNGESVVAFVKPQAEEATFRYDAGTNTVIKTQKVFDTELQAMRTIETPEAEGNKAFEEYLSEIPDAWLKDSENPEQLRQEIAKDEYTYRQNAVAAFKSQTEYQPTLIAQVAKRYGISPDEVPMKEGVFGPREGIGVGKTAVREYIASRIDRLLGFNAVPVTVLRAEKNDADKVVDVSSVQEAVKPKGPEGLLKVMGKKDFEEILASGGDHPDIQEIIKIANEHYILGALDGHNENVISGEAIDNGLSGGISRETTKTNEDGTTETVVEPLDPLRSIHMELIQMLPDAKQDDASLKQLRFVSQHVGPQLGESASRTGNTNGSESRIGALIEETLGEHEAYLSDLLRLQYGNDAIARTEAKELLKRIAYVAEHGRPPQMRIGHKGGELFPLAKEVFPGVKIPEHRLAA